MIFKNMLSTFVIALKVNIQHANMLIASSLSLGQQAALWVTPYRKHWRREGEHAHSAGCGVYTQKHSSAFHFHSLGIKRVLYKQGIHWGESGDMAYLTTNPADKERSVSAVLTHNFILLHL